MSEASGNTVESHVPARIDRLPWAKWHWLVIAGLGITWILDGLEVTVVGSIGSVINTPVSGLNISSTEVGLAGSIYILGAVIGSLFFSYLTDRYGRRNLFMITLAIYLTFSVLTGFSWNFWSFAAFRFLTGAGIGGEYSAIYSAIDEFMPARFRGQVALAISGSYWIGGAAGAALSLVLLNPAIIDQFYGWRISFFLGAILGLTVLYIRRYLPESPRWLLTHGRSEEAERIMGEIEDDVRESTGREELPEPEEEPITIEERGSIGFGLILRAMFIMYPKRTVLGLTLMGTQAFLYNAIFFTYALVLTTFFKVSDGSVGYYLIAFAFGNLLGPLTLGRLFDRIGRRPMIAGCYFLSGALLLVSGILFTQGLLTAVTQTIAWVIIFFFASSAASAGYLTVSEVFPMEIRAMAIAVFYSIGTGVGGITGPALYGRLVDTGTPSALFIGYVIAAVLMIVAAVVELILGIKAEGRSLESVAAPLTAIQQETGATA